MYGSSDIESSPRPPSRWPMILLITLFVVYGTLSTILGKVLYQTSGIGSNGFSKNFEKPLFANMGMFFAMFCVLLYQPCIQQTKSDKDESKRLINNESMSNGRIIPGQGNINDQDTTPLNSGYVSFNASESKLPSFSASKSNASSANNTSQRRLFMLVLIPAFCDFVAMYMMNIGLLWINASIWQMLRGSVVIFSALVRRCWLGLFLKNKERAGVLLVTVSLALIGYACIKGDDSTAGVDSSTDQKSIGLIMVLFAEFLGAVQMVVEEWLLHDIDATDIQVIGYEGIWGLILCFAMIPIAQQTNIEGIHEDSYDTYIMLKSSPKLLLIFLIYCVVILGYNVSGMRLTMHLNAVARNILDMVRVSLVWLIMLAVYYVGTNVYGEQWNSWSWLQLVGFIVMLAGIHLYSTASSSH